ncbi:hypothetical protein ACFXI0_17050 [Kitasatospora indigofera]|uniref:hypothetical protein n=1 Tax=Kitasatospora indigofera TaxID=67307 RepID=UPI0036A3616E
MSDETFPMVGDFRELGHGRPDGASLRAAAGVRELAQARELIQYLHSGVVLAATAAITHDVLSPDRTVIGGLSLLTDGRWLWYSDLAHYVEHHHVALDPRFVAHAQSRDWTVPHVSRQDLMDMEAALFDDVED